MRLRVQARPVPSEPFAVHHRCAGDGTGETTYETPERGQEDFAPVHRRGTLLPRAPEFPEFEERRFQLCQELHRLFPVERGHARLEHRH